MDPRFFGSIAPLTPTDPGLAKVAGATDALGRTWVAGLLRDMFSGVGAFGQAASGQMPVTAGMRREDLTDIPGSAQPADPMVKAATDAAGLAMTGGAAGVPKGAIGSTFSDPLAPGIRAYHGSPHDFDRFDLSKIGTGEGAQAYGQGLYFAENEGVARSYRDALSTPVARLDPSKIKDEIADVGGFSPEAVKMARDELKNLNGDAGETLRMLDLLNANTGYARAREAAQVIRAMKPETYRGRMYEVNINARPEQFLDWDRPPSADALSRIQDAASGIKPNVWERATGTGRDLAKWAAENPPLDRTGMSWLGTLKRGYGSDANASAALREAGIPGIKYLDKGSRGAGEGSSNYVVFDDKLIDILRKYAIPGAVGGSMFGSLAPQGDL